MVSNSTLTGLATAVVLTAAMTFVVYRSTPVSNYEPKAKTLVPNAGDADAFEFQSDGLVLVCSRTNATWFVERPFSGQANQEAVRRFLDALSSARIRETLSERDVRKRGLDDNRLALGPLAGARPMVVLRRGETSTRLAFGSHAVDGRLYVDLDGPGKRILYAVDPELADELPRSAATFRNQRLLPLPRELLRRVEVNDGATPAVLELDAAGRWWLRKPFLFLADETRVNTLLDYLFSPKSDTSPLSGDASSGASVDADLEVSFQFSDPDASGLRRVNYRFINDREDEKRSRVFSNENPDGVSAPKDLPDMLREIGTFRDTRLFPGRHADELAALRIARESEPVVEFRRAEGSWTLSQPIDHRAIGRSVDEFAEILLALRDDGVVPTPSRETPPDTQAYPAAPDDLEAPRPFLSLAFEFLDGSAVTAAVARAIHAPSPDAGTVWTLTQEASGTVWTLPQGPARLVPDGSPDPAPWDEAALRALLDPEVLPDAGDGRPLVAERVESIAPLSVEPYGLLEPFASIAVPGADATVLLGGTAPDGCRFAMLRGGYTVYALSAETAAALAASAMPPTP